MYIADGWLLLGSLSVYDVLFMLVSVVDGKDRRMEGRKPVSGTLNAERSTLNAEVGIRQ